MFKRLKALFGSSKATEDQPAVPPAVSAEDDAPIVAYDEHGRQLAIPRREWREQVLQPNLRRHWDEPDALYQQILTGVNDGFAADVAEAAQRLLAIDPVPERAYSILGIVQMKNGQADAARATLEAGIAKAGRTGVLLTNLAKAMVEQGQREAGLAVLWEAVQADPNLDNGLLWWASLEEERGGEAAWLEALRRVAALPGSWRAQLWLARHHLERGEANAAFALYRAALALASADGGALTMISGDLGNNGQAAAIPDLLAPVYDPAVHGAQPGLNLLRALHEAKRADEGEALLKRLYALGQPHLKQHLDSAADAFTRLRAKSAAAQDIDPATMQLSMVALEQPVWHYGLRQADWLFAQKPAEAPRVGFSALSVDRPAGEDETARQQQEDDSGRLTRAIPLYLAEAVHYWTGFATVVHVAVVNNSGPVVFGSPEDASVCDRVPPGTPWYVTGILAPPAQPDGEHRLTLRLWDVARREAVTEESVTTPRAGLGEAVLALERRLLACLGEGRGTALDSFYQRPPAQLMEPYLSYLGQSFTLSMIANGVGGKSSLWGERGMLEWPLTLGMHWPQCEVPALMFLSGLGKAVDYGSDLLPEFRQRGLSLLRQAAPGTPAARLAPVAWMAFGMREDLAFHRAALAPASAPDYLAWLERLEGSVGDSVRGNATC